jgi:hypothetical protein
MADLRNVVEARIHALACHVTSLSNCNRRWGSAVKTKRLSGTVLSVDRVPTKTESGRFLTAITGEYDLELEDYSTKVVQLMLKNIRAGEVPGVGVGAGKAGAGEMPDIGAGEVPDNAPPSYAPLLDAPLPQLEVPPAPPQHHSLWRPMVQE